MLHGLSVYKNQKIIITEHETWHRNRFCFQVNFFIIQWLQLYFNNKNILKAPKSSWMHHKTVLKTIPDYFEYALGFKDISE